MSIPVASLESITVEPPNLVLSHSNGQRWERPADTIELVRFVEEAEAGVDPAYAGAKTDFPVRSLGDLEDAASALTAALSLPKIVPTAVSADERERLHFELDRAVA